MNIERERERQIELREFTFPNNHPTELVEEEMRRILNHRYVDPEFEFDPDPEKHMGTKWFVDVKFTARKPIPKIAEIEDEDELNLELLAGQRLED